MDGYYIETWLYHKLWYLNTWMLEVFIKAHVIRVNTSE